MNDLVKAYDAWKIDPKTDTLDVALKAAHPTMTSAVKSYVGREDPIAMSHAKILTADAFKSFDPKKQVQLRTHLLNQLQPLRRFAASRRFVTKIPERVQYDLSGLRNSEIQLNDSLGRSPTEEELADDTGYSMKRIQRLRKYSSPVSESGSRNEEGEERGIPGEVADPMQDWVAYVYHDMSALDKKIFEWRTGFNGLPVRGVVDIAKELGISAGAVTQRANKISQRIEEGVSRAGTLR